MSDRDIRPIELCPINFKKFDALNSKVGNIEQTLLLSKIFFHLKETKLTKNSLSCITRSREQMANWFGFSMRKLDALLLSLEQKGFIIRQSGMWKGKRSLFISVKNVETDVPLNLSLFDLLVEHTGSITAALTYARIAFIYNTGKVSHAGINWCYLRKNTLASFTGISVRKLDQVLSVLIRKGLLLKKNLVSCGKRQAHFHIPKPSLQALKKKFIAKFEELKSLASRKICRIEPAKSAISIKKSITTKKTNNITTDKLSKNDKDNSAKKALHRGIIFSDKQIKYVGGAIRQLIERDNINITNLEAFKSEVLFATEKLIRSGYTFSHALNRLCSIIRSNKWTTPFGFNKYSKQGRAVAKRTTCLVKEWAYQKKIECNSKALEHISSAIGECKSQIGGNCHNAITVKHQDIHNLSETSCTTNQRVLRSEKSIACDNVRQSIKRCMERAKNSPPEVADILRDVIKRLQHKEKEIMWNF